jgi:hypothetical protein
VVTSNLGSIDVVAALIREGVDQARSGRLICAARAVLAEDHRA